MHDDITYLRTIAGEVCQGKATAEQERFIVAFYRKVFRHPFSSCKCQLCDAIFLILNNTKKMETTFKLKKGIVLRQHGKPYRVTHSTLTNELAIKHLRACPGDAKFFDYIPPDAWAAIKGVDPEQETEVMSETPQPDIYADRHTEQNDDLADEPKKPRKRTRVKK